MSARTCTKCFSDSARFARIPCARAPGGYHVLLNCDRCRPDAIVCETALYAWRNVIGAALAVVAALLFGGAIWWWRAILPPAWLALCGSGAIMTIASSYIFQLDQRLFTHQHFLRDVYLDGQAAEH